MSIRAKSRRKFLRTIGLGAGACVLSAKDTLVETAIVTLPSEASYHETLTIPRTTRSTFERPPSRSPPSALFQPRVYNGHFPGPLLRFKEGQQVTVDMYNDTTHRSSCIGTVRNSQQKWTERPRKAHHSFPHMANAAWCLAQSRGFSFLSHPQSRWCKSRRRPI